MPSEAAERLIRLVVTLEDSVGAASVAFEEGIASEEFQSILTELSDCVSDLRVALEDFVESC